MQNPDPSQIKRDSLTEGLLPLNTNLNGFRIQGILRAGQSNNVYVATSKSGQEVALKEYFPRRIAKRLPSGRIGVASEENQMLFENGVKGFIAEALALGKIKSDLLAQCVAAFRINGTAYLATELVPGETLEAAVRTKMKEGSGPTESHLRLVFWSLLNAVQVVHDQGFLHLDIKPSNVIMKDENSPVLIDLGGARRFPVPLLKPGAETNFTPGFAAPEQHEKDYVMFGPATDIYGIGASLLYCMTGRIPQQASGRRLEDKIKESFERCRSRYSVNFTETVEKCMAMDIRERHCSVQELQHIISKF